MKLQAGRDTLGKVTGNPNGVTLLIASSVENKVNFQDTYKKACVGLDDTARVLNMVMMAWLCE